MVLSRAYNNTLDRILRTTRNHYIKVSRTLNTMERAVSDAQRVLAVCESQESGPLTPKQDLR
jgi:hypothetical protein